MRRKATCRLSGVQLDALIRKHGLRINALAKGLAMDFQTPAKDQIRLAIADMGVTESTYDAMRGRMAEREN